MKHYRVATFTAPNKLLRAVRKKAKRLHGARSFSKHVAAVLAADVALVNPDRG